MSKSQIDPPMVPPMRGEEILLPLRFGEGWGGVFRIYARVNNILPNQLKN